MSIVKGKAGMGGRTGTDLFFTKGPTEAPHNTHGGTYAYKFCKELLKAGNEGRSKKQIRKADWNPRGHSFKQTYDRLVKEGMAFEYGRHGKYMLTPKGIKAGNSWRS